MTTSHPRQKLVDAVRRTMLLAALFFVPAGFSIRRPLLYDADLWWHLRTGQWILQHRAVPLTDPFSTYGAGKPWVAYSWFFDVLIYGFFQRWQLVGVLAFQILLTTAITAAIIHLIRKLVPDFTKAAVLTGLVVVALLPLYTPRSWLFTILLFVLELDIILTTRADGQVRRLLWLPIIMALWANVHILFVYGLFLLGVATAEQWLGYWRPADKLTGSERYGFTWAMLASLVAVAANPYHFKLYKVVFDLARQGGALNYVSELQALSFRNFTDFLVPLIGFGAVAALAWKRHLNAFWIVLLSWSAIASFRSARDLWVLVVVGVAAIAGEIRSEKDEPYRVPKLQWAAVVAIFIVGGLFLAHATAFSKAKLQDNVASKLPVKAVEYVKSQRFTGPLYSTYEWGGYLIWTLPEIPVGMDSRQNVHGDFRIMRAGNTWFATHEWTADPELASARLIILPLDMPLTQVLRLEPRYRVAYEDKVAVVFVHEAGSELAVSSSRSDKPAGSL